MLLRPKNINQKTLFLKNKFILRKRQNVANRIDVVSQRLSNILKRFKQNIPKKASVIIPKANFGKFLSQKPIDEITKKIKEDNLKNKKNGKLRILI